MELKEARDARIPDLVLVWSKLPESSLLWRHVRGDVLGERHRYQEWPLSQVRHRFRVSSRNPESSDTLASALRRASAKARRPRGRNEESHNDKLPLTVTENSHTAAVPAIPDKVSSAWSDWLEPVLPGQGRRDILSDYMANQVLGGREHGTLQ